jgi:MYXO-CTERM domain-containing protein
MFSSSAPVTIWAGSPEGTTNAINNLGDDIALAMGKWDGSSTYRVRSYAQSAARVFARNGSVVTVNGVNTTVGASETFALAGGQDIVVTSTAPFLVQSQDSQNQTDWAKWLRPLPKVDSDGDTVNDTTEAPGGECQSTAPDSDNDGAPDFLDTDSDNDCIPDSNALEAGSARTNASLPAGAHCTGTTPICKVQAGTPYVGTCIACNGNFGSSTSAACPSSSSSICLANGSCVPCNGDFGAGTSAACPSSTAPHCVAGGCVSCDGPYGGGTAAACQLPTAPVCATALGACLGCAGGFGSGQSLACQLASAPVCVFSGACMPCNGDNGSFATQQCPTTANPYCFAAGQDAGAAGTCGKCTTSADCVGHPNGTICNTQTGGCGQSCSNDSDCNTQTQWCAGTTCTSKTPNAQPIPNVAPVSGQCTAANGQRVCRSGVCSATNNECGLASGDSCATDAAASPDGGNPGNALCQTFICSPNGTCGDCHVDSDCGTATSGKVCDDSTLTCKDGCRGTGGNKCSGLLICSSTTNAIGACFSNNPDAGPDGGKDAGVDSGVLDSGSGTDAAVEDAATDAETDATLEGGASFDDSGVFEGGGISCSTSHAATGTGAAGLLGVLALLGLVRRRKR